MSQAGIASQEALDSGQAWLRLVVTMLLMTVGSGGMYIVAVVLPAVQAEFGISRALASSPYTALLVGFGVGGVWLGRLADRHGVAWPLLLGAAGIGAGYIGSALADGIWTFSLAQGLGVGLLASGSSFGPLMADATRWFVRRRGIAVALCASGNYLAGAVWPPVVQHFVDSVGWRQTFIGLGVFGMVTMAVLALLLRQRPPPLLPAAAARASPDGAVPSERPFGLSPGRAQFLLGVAGLACCVAMAMPQVHIVALCTDLGFGAARGAQMLSLMLAFGVASRIISGLVCDRIGGLRTLLFGSMLQCIALALFLPFDSLVSLYVVSALFGLFQGGIVPSYAVIIREHFPARETAVRLGTVLLATMAGMALGGWMSGKIFDLSGSYQAAFVNGMAWSALNMVIVGTLLLRHHQGRGLGTPRTRLQ